MNTNIDITSSSSLIAPFQTVGFLESKWLEVLKDLVEYGNKNILGSFKLYLTVEEKGQQNNNEATTNTKIKEVFSGILDIKREERGTGVGKGRTEVPMPTPNHNNPAWSRPRDKNGRLISSSAAAAGSMTIVGATAAAITTSTSTSTQTQLTQAATSSAASSATTKPPSSSWQNKLRDSKIFIL